jgi:hypothetical protein
MLAREYCDAIKKKEPRIIVFAVSACPNLAPNTGCPTATTPSILTSAEAGAVMYQIKDILERNEGIVPVSGGFII